MSISDPPTNGLTLRIGIPGFSYGDLYLPERLHRLAEVFYDSLRSADAQLFERFLHYRSTKGVEMRPEEISAVIVETAPHVSAFVSELFQVHDIHGRMRRAVEQETVVFVFKREFVTRRSLKRFPNAAAIDTPSVAEAYNRLASETFPEVYGADDPERATAMIVVGLMNLEKSLRSAPFPSEQLAAEATDLLERVERARRASPVLASRIPETNGVAEATNVINALLEIYDEWVAMEHYQPSDTTKHWVSLRTPRRVDHANLVELHVAADMPVGTRVGPAEEYRLRDGFKLTDARFSHREVLDHVEYCIYCHERDRDSCSKGLHEKDGSLKHNLLGVTLHGCPLDEKISEMHLLKHHGDGLAGLVVIMIDNPMCPGTGHRICNDCMKGCIYQKQEPVNIPQIETGVLTEILDYPFGFEIYSLLTRWNPLNVARPHALPYNGKKVLVVGLGPAGYTLAHFLVNEGFGVVGADGLKIEPLPARLTGTRDAPPEPVADWRTLYDELDDRVLLGFGGVSEYGITVRWDKNFLKVIYIALARRRTFRIYGGVRFGGTITIDDAWRLGFDHVAIATGAGRPTIVPMKNNLARGVRQASDFLMALQLTGAFKKGSLTNLQMRLPTVVIGGGLTGIDTATEAMAYYPVQVERVLDRVESLRSELGDERFDALFTDEEREILTEYLEHANAIRKERDTAAAEGRKPDFIRLIRSWGGVSLVYRKTITDSPAYRLNHEEIVKALEEGIYFIENLSPLKIALDRYGATESILFERHSLDESAKWRGTGELVKLPARSIMVAAGTSPNTIIERENPGEFAYDKWHQFFSPHVAERSDSSSTVAATL